MKIEHNISCAPYTTFACPSTAQTFVTVASVDDLRSVAQYASVHAEDIVFVGGGSNIVLCDAHLEKMLVRVALMGREYEQVSDTIVRAQFGAGEVFDACIEELVTKGFWGLENLSGIPGTIGATPIQNVGAYGVEIGEMIAWVEYFDMRTGETIRLLREECNFGYRDSLFKTVSQGIWCVTRVAFDLSIQPNPRLTYADLVLLASSPTLTQQSIRETVLAVRRNKFPDWTQEGTAGSFFKNPIISSSVAQRLLELYPELPVYPYSDTQVKIPLGWILDRVLGLKGYADGSVRLYEKQALVVVASRGTQGSAIDAFAKKIEQKIFDATGLHVEREVQIIQNNEVKKK